jgi:hypothetical protein
MNDTTRWYPPHITNDAERIDFLWDQLGRVTSDLRTQLQREASSALKAEQVEMIARFTEMEKDMRGKMAKMLPS